MDTNSIQICGRASAPTTAQYTDIRQIQSGFGLGILKKSFLTSFNPQIRHSFWAMVTLGYRLGSHQEDR